MLKINVDFGKLRLKLRRIEKDNNKAIVRALNVVGNRAVGVLAKLVAKDVGSNVGTIKRQLIKTKATSSNKIFIIEAGGRRINLIKPKELKKGGRRIGISFVGDNGVRKKLTDHIQGGSKPFIIKIGKGVTASGKVKKGNPVAVYREKGSKRVTTNMVWHSIPSMVADEYEDVVQQFMIDNFKKEYLNQLERIPYFKKQ